jgi:molybdate transport system substrate-binding protein
MLLARNTTPTVSGCAAIVAAAVLLGGDTVVGQELAIAAASDLQAVFPTVAERYHRQTGRSVRLTYGSSGNFFSQIQNGAPFDLFFSADVEYPRRLEAAGLAEPGTLHEYATGRIVLWVRKDSGLDVRRGLPVLTDSRVRRIAIANPQHAPYGRAAVAALRGAKLYEALRGKLVLGENVSQAAQFVQSGNADVGILALSVALAPAVKATGAYAEIPAAFHPPIDQAAVVISRSRNKTAARDFLRFMDRPEIIQLLQAFGFMRPVRSVGGPADEAAKIGTAERTVRPADPPSPGCGPGSGEARRSAERIGGTRTLNLSIRLKPDPMRMRCAPRHSVR